MARIFTVAGTNMSIAGAGPSTMVFINPPAAPSVGVRVLRMWASQSGTTTQNMIRIQYHTQVTAFPTLTSATPAKTNRNDPNAAVITGGTAGAAGTAGTNASAEGAGTKTVINEYAFNNQIGWEWFSNPSKGDVVEIGAGSASGFGIAFPANPTSTTGWDVGLTYEEF